MFPGSALASQVNSALFPSSFDKFCGGVIMTAPPGIKKVKISRNV